MSQAHTSHTSHTSHLQNKSQTPSKNYRQICQKIIGPNRHHSQYDNIYQNNFINNLNPYKHNNYHYPTTTSQHPILTVTTTSQQQRQRQRLTFKQIQNITKQMMKDKKTHQYNLGVLNNIKGKMYCLRLGQVSNYKEFSHYFYTSQYRRMYTKKLTKNQSSLSKYTGAQEKLEGSVNTQNNWVQKNKNIGKNKSIYKTCKNIKVITQPSQQPNQPNLNTITNNDGFLTGVQGSAQKGKTQSKIIKKQSMNSYDFSDNQDQIKKTQYVQKLEQLKLDQKIKEKVNKFILPLVGPVILGDEQIKDMKERLKQKDYKVMKNTQNLKDMKNMKDKDMKEKEKDLRDSKQNKNNKRQNNKQVKSVLGERKDGRRYSMNRML